MTKLGFYFFCISFCLIFFSCGNNKNKQDEKQPIITVTIEPQRYFLEQLVDSTFKVVTMVPPGSSPETYDPSPVQMSDLSKSAAYFAIGHIGFEVMWLDKLKTNNPNLLFFDNSKGIKLIEAEDEHHHDHGEENHNHAGGVDPHTWSSPKEAMTIIHNMYDALLKINPSNKDIYKNNLSKLEEKIAKTDSMITTLLSNISTKSFIIYHPALSYFARDYGLTQYCIEVGGKEPSPAQLKEMVEKARESGTKVIFIQQEFDSKNAEIIAKETGCKLVVINPLAYDWDKELINIAKALSSE